MLKWKVTFLEKKYGSVNKEYLRMICNKMCASLYYDIDLCVNSPFEAGLPPPARTPRLPQGRGTPREH